MEHSLLLRRVFVPRVVDESNSNAQVSNVKALIAASCATNIHWIVSHYLAPESGLAEAENVTLNSLWRRRFWILHMLLLYQGRYDAIFCPGGKVMDSMGLRLRRMTGREVPVIATLEGLVGDEEREAEYSAWAEHPVHCQRVPKGVIRRYDRVYRDAAKIIAITPFLEKMGRRRYGDKVQFVPLGVDTKRFTSGLRQVKPVERIIGAGRLYENKQPDLFLELASKSPAVEFIWYGDGAMRNALNDEARSRDIRNVRFPGAVSNNELSSHMQAADLFVHPSLSEGDPKVVLEAAASGLPVVCFNYYEPYSVRDGVTGYAVADRERFSECVGELIQNPELAYAMGKAGADLARDRSWDLLAPRWHNEIVDTLSNSA